MARTTPTHTPIGKYTLAFIVSFSLLISDVSYQTFSGVRGFVQATGIYGQLILGSLSSHSEKFTTIFQEKQNLIKANKELKDDISILQNKIFLEKKSQVLVNDLISLNDEMLSLSQGKETFILQLASFGLKNYLCCSTHSLHLKNPKKFKLKKNLPVANGKTFIGQTSDTDFNLIKVILFSDASHILPVKIKDLFCNARGAGKPLQIICKVDLDLKLLNIQSSDTVVTSGMGGIFPKNIAASDYLHDYICWFLG